MAAPGLGFNIEPVTASSAGIWSGFESNFSTGPFSLHGNATAESGTSYPVAIIIASALVALAIFMRGRK